MSLREVVEEHGPDGVEGAEEGAEDEPSENAGMQCIN